MQIYYEKSLSSAQRSNRGYFIRLFSYLLYNSFLRYFPNIIDEFLIWNRFIKYFFIYFLYIILRKKIFFVQVIVWNTPFLGFVVREEKEPQSVWYILMAAIKHYHPLWSSLAMLIHGVPLKPQLKPVISLRTSQLRSFIFVLVLARYIYLCCDKSNILVWDLLIPQPWVLIITNTRKVSISSL